MSTEYDVQVNLSLEDNLSNEFASIVTGVSEGTEELVSGFEQLRSMVEDKIVQAFESGRISVEQMGESMEQLQNTTHGNVDALNDVYTSLNQQSVGIQRSATSMIHMARMGLGLENMLSRLEMRTLRQTFLEDRLDIVRQRLAITTQRMEAAQRDITDLFTAFAPDSDQVLQAEENVQTLQDRIKSRLEQLARDAEETGVPLDQIIAGDPVLKRLYNQLDEAQEALRSLRIGPPTELTQMWEDLLPKIQSVKDAISQDLPSEEIRKKIDDVTEAATKLRDRAKELGQTKIVVSTEGILELTKQWDEAAVAARRFQVTYEIFQRQLQVQNVALGISFASMAANIVTSMGLMRQTIPLAIADLAKLSGGSALLGVAIGTGIAALGIFTFSLGFIIHGLQDAYERTHDWDEAIRLTAETIQQQFPPVLRELAIGWTWEIGKIAQGFEWLAGRIQELPNRIIREWNAWQTSWNEFWSSAQSKFANFLAVVNVLWNKTWESVSTVFKSFAQVIVDIWNNSIGKLINIAVDLWKKLTGGSIFPEMMEDIRNVVRSGMDDTNSIFDNSAMDLVSSAGLMSGLVVDQFGDMSQGIRSTMDATARDLQRTLDSMMTPFRGTGIVPQLTTAISPTGVRYVTPTPGPSVFTSLSQAQAAAGGANITVTGTGAGQVYSVPSITGFQGLEGAVQFTEPAFIKVHPDEVLLGKDTKSSGPIVNVEINVGSVDSRERVEELSRVLGREIRRYISGNSVVQA